ncbi:FUSC family protein, partial [Desulfovibrio sp. OttesenSCG-928-A18]|nr:FUSC family protein [Desulfovibrio sp. OttesenSCG-928-A18]
MGLNGFFSLYLRYGLKVGIACALSYGLSTLLGSPYAVWAVVAAIVAMQINVADSLQAGALRLTGTILGAAVGVTLLLTLPKTQLVMGLAVFAVSAVCGYLARYTNRSSAISIAAMVVFFTGAQLLSTAGGTREAVTFGLMRVLEIAIGVGSAFLVSILLWPVRLVDTLRADLCLQFLESARLLDAIVNSFLAGQQQLPYSMLQSIETKIWDNHERLSRARKHESFLYRYEHKTMSIQVMAMDRTAESLRAMMETLNDYDEEGQDPLTGPELRSLADAIMAALRHLGGESPTAPAPDLVRRLTGGVAAAEDRLAALRTDGTTRSLNLHKILQFFTFYQAMRLLAESMLVALD